MRRSGRRGTVDPHPPVTCQGLMVIHAASNKATLLLVLAEAGSAQQAHQCPCVLGVVYRGGAEGEGGIH
jgi:hypothetical protein